MDERPVREDINFVIRSQGWPGPSPDPRRAAPESVEPLEAYLLTALLALVVAAPLIAWACTRPWPLTRTPGWRRRR